MSNGISREDIDPQETQEWLDSIESIIESIEPSESIQIIEQVQGGGGAASGGATRPGF